MIMTRSSHPCYKTCWMFYNADKMLQALQHFKTKDWLLQESLFFFKYKPSILILPETLIVNQWVINKNNGRAELFHTHLLKFEYWWQDTAGMKTHFDSTWMNCQWTFKSIEDTIKCKACCKKGASSLNGSHVVMINSIGGLECVFCERVPDGLAKKICCLALSFESVMFRPHFTLGNGLFGKNNNRGTYIDQRSCSLAATHLGWMINASCFVGINLQSVTSEWLWRWLQVQVENDYDKKTIFLFVSLHFYKQRGRAKGDTNDISNVVSILNY